jgi:hypothetical protein
MVSYGSFGPWARTDVELGQVPKAAFEETCIGVWIGAEV